MRTPSYTTQAQVRMSFWELTGWNRAAERRIRRQRQDKYFRCDVRSSFVDHVDMLARDGRINEALASRVTLN